jgi:GGDEF domain-containing protein
VARLGGDEFLVICGDVDEISDVDELAQRITYLVEAPSTSRAVASSLSARASASASAVPVTTRSA